MIAVSDLEQVSEVVAEIAAVTCGASLVTLRLLARRSIATMLTLIAAVTVVTSLAGVMLIGIQMLISSSEDRNVLLAVTAIAGLAGFAVALLAGRRLTRATGALLDAVRDAGKTGYFFPPEERLPAELAALSDGLVAAHSELAQARGRERAFDASRRELVAWVSHDLRTPLAGLRAMAEALEDDVVTDPAQAHRYKAQIRMEADRLTGMIDDLFDLARIQGGALRLSQSLAGLDDLVDGALASAEPLARTQGVQLRGSADRRLQVYVDATELGRALRNLLVNAIGHTAAGETVEVAGKADQGRACVTVSDTCGGIPPEHLPRVFDVGFRGEAARTPGPEKRGGLGLSIARGIVEAHAGRIAVRNTGGGCQFIIWLPLWSMPPDAAQSRHRAAATHARAPSRRALRLAR